MEHSSEYTFPIFISSTDYNLKDLRAELAKFLSELGYKPLLSSAEGFPDNSPYLEPWESCIPVLDRCFVVVLVIDGRYGSGLKWPNYSEYFSERKIAPTHGEYIFAHRNKKRMLVFVRKSLMPHYQSYRTVMEKCNNDKVKAEELLSPTLPEYITFETLDFINEVKTTRPIPWIKEFEDITCVKREIQKKMLNELAELFLVKNKYADIVIDSFNKVMDSLSLEKQKEVLQTINATKEITEAVGKLEQIKEEIEDTNSKLAEARKNGDKDREKYEHQITTLKKKISNLENETLSSSNSHFFIQNGQVKIGNPNYIDNSELLSGGSIFYTKDGYLSDTGLPTSYLALSRKCDNCGKLQTDLLSATMLSSATAQFHTCSSCKRNLCNSCWPKYTLSATGQISSMTVGDTSKKCPKCADSNK